MNTFLRPISISFYALRFFDEDFEISYVCLYLICRLRGDMFKKLWEMYLEIKKLSIYRMHFSENNFLS